MSNWKSTNGPDTYLHAGAGSKGWPHDHTVEDNFDLPPMPNFELPPMPKTAAPAYNAEHTRNGGAVLVFYAPSKIIAAFETYADAQLAAKALNETNGY